MSVDIDCIIVGAGVVGLAIARELAATGREVMVIEQHDRVGAETSSRNSEVIHAGLYYTPGSLKARLCLKGKNLLYSFAEENGITAKRLGKLLVATSEAELPKLHAIAANAAASGVDDLIALSPEEARALEPNIDCAAAYLSPSTGVVDSHALMTALEGHIQAGGGQVVLSTRVCALAQTADSFRLTITTGNHASAPASDADGESLTCRTLVLAAGLHSTPLAKTLFSGEHRTSYAPPMTYFAKGHYFTLSGRPPFSHLVYPIPHDGGLGVHLTLDVAGDAKFGPDVTWTDQISYSFDDADGSRRHTFLREIRRWWPDLPEAALQPGYTGIRPKLSRQDEPAADFAIHGPVEHGRDNLVVLYGIESPGLTAALAIARHVTLQLQPH